MHTLSAGMRQRITNTTDVVWLHKQYLLWEEHIQGWNEVNKDTDETCANIKQEIVETTKQNQQIIDDEIEFNNMWTLLLNECFNFETLTVEYVEYCYNNLTYNIDSKTLTCVSKKCEQWLNKAHKFNDKYSTLKKEIDNFTKSERKDNDTDIKVNDKSLPDSNELSSQMSNSNESKPLMYTGIEDLRNLLIEKIGLANHVGNHYHEIIKSVKYLNDLKDNRHEKFVEVLKTLKEQREYVEGQCAMEKMKLNSTTSCMESIRQIVCDLKDTNVQMDMQQVQMRMESITNKMIDFRKLYKEYQTRSSSKRDDLIKFKPIDPF